MKYLGILVILGLLSGCVGQDGSLIVALSRCTFVQGTNSTAQVSMEGGADVDAKAALK